MRRVNICLDDETFANLEAAAGKACVSVSAYMRYMLDEMLAKANAPQVYGVKIIDSKGKIYEIKAIRAVTCWGLKEAKDFVEQEPEKKVLTSFVDAHWSYETSWVVDKTHEKLTQEEADHLVNLLKKDFVEAVVVPLS
jgi:hypothetical protein